MNNDPHPKLELQISSSKALARRIDRRIDLVERLLAEADAEQALVLPSSFTNSLGMKMMWCPPGEFVMGSPEDEEGRKDNEDQVHVRISQGFWMAGTTVTQGQWQALMGSNPSGFKGSERLPVQQVSWHDAQEFCSSLNATDPGPAGYHYALPTEAQWEYACRAGSSGLYHGELDDVAWYVENCGGRPPEVGSKQANAWGLHDMHGNVSEWCADSYGIKLPGGTDPAVLTSGARRVVRGGLWGLDAASCRAASRESLEPGSRNGFVGFRPALVLSNP